MCAPQVAKAVRARAQREGVSRRNFLRLGGAAAAGLSLGPKVAPAFAHARAQELSGEIIDLSHIFTVEVPTYVPDAVPNREDVFTVENDGFYVQRWTFGEHTGTHADIPAHFISGAESVDIYSPGVFLSPAVVIDITTKAEADPDALLTADDIRAWEADNGEIPPGALVCMYSGWESRWSSIEDFRNADTDGVMHFPGFGADAAEFLVTERDIHGIAVDTLSLDNGPSATFDVHFTILGAGKYGLEGVANLGQIKDRNAMIFVGIPRWEAGSGGPCRVLAVL